MTPAWFSSVAKRPIEYSSRAPVTNRASARRGRRRTASREGILIRPLHVESRERSSPRSLVLALLAVRDHGTPLLERAMVVRTAASTEARARHLVVSHRSCNGIAHSVGPRDSTMGSWDRHEGSTARLPKVCLQTSSIPKAPPCLEPATLSAAVITVPTCGRWNPGHPSMYRAHGVA